MRFGNVGQILFMYNRLKKIGHVKSWGRVPGQTATIGSPAAGQGLILGRRRAECCESLSLSLSWAVRLMSSVKLMNSMRLMSIGKFDDTYHQYDTVLDKITYISSS